MSISTPSPGFFGTATLPPTILNGSRGSRSPFYQIQWVSIAVTVPGAAAAQCVNIARDIEVIVGMRSLRESPRVANLRDTHRARHRPEMRSASGIVTDCNWIA
jgi:hypothetical protein